MDFQYNIGGRYVHKYEEENGERSPGRSSECRLKSAVWQCGKNQGTRVK
jgi:hypothetical protein